MSERFSFKADLWDGFTAVTKNATQGIHTVKEIYGYFKKRAQIEDEYAKSLTKLHQKVFKNENDDSTIGTIGEAWDNVERAAQSEGLTHQSLASNLTEQVIEPTKNLIRECDERLKVLLIDGQRHISDHQQYVKNLEKAKSKYRKLCAESDSAKTAFEEARDSRSKEAPKLEKRMQACVQEAEEAEAEYKTHILQTNQFQTAYLNVLMPRIMEELERLEMYRYSGLRDQLKVFTNMLASLPPREVNIIQPVTNAVNAINPEADLQLVIKRTRTEAKRPDPFVFEKYDATGDNSYESGRGGALKKGKSLLARKLTTLGRKPNNTSPTAAPKQSIFGMRLEDLMKRQENTAPNLEVPLPLVTLACAMMKLDAPHTEGVFRVPAPASELVKLTKQLEEGNYDVDTSSDTGYSVHSVAACFKKILRELPDPLVPQSIYNTCIETAANSTSPKDSVAILYLSNFPSQNLTLVLFIIRFLQEFLHSDAVAASKMNADNLAMVFAPSLLKTTIEDLNLMVANVNHEKIWVRHLLESLPHSGSWRVLPAQNGAEDTTEEESKLTQKTLQKLLSTAVLNPSVALPVPISAGSPSLVESPLALSPAFRAASPVTVSGDSSYKPDSSGKSDLFLRGSPLDGQAPRGGGESFLSTRRIGPLSPKSDLPPTPDDNRVYPESGSPQGTPPAAGVTKVGKELDSVGRERDKYKQEVIRIKAEMEQERIKTARERARFEEEKNKLEYEKRAHEQEKLRAAEIQQKAQEIELKKAALEKLVEKYQIENASLLREKEEKQKQYTTTPTNPTTPTVSNGGGPPPMIRAHTAAPGMLLSGIAPQASGIARARSPSDSTTPSSTSSSASTSTSVQPPIPVPVLSQSPPPIATNPSSSTPTTTVQSPPNGAPFSSPLPTAAKARDMIVAEMNFLANRISNTEDYTHMLGLSKSVRTIKQGIQASKNWNGYRWAVRPAKSTTTSGLDSILSARNITEADVTTYSAEYYQALPRPTIAPVTEVQDNPDNPDLEKIRKMRPAVSKTMGIIVDGLSALLVLSAERPQDHANILSHLNNLVTQLPPPEEHVKALRVEASILNEIVPSLIENIKENFPNTPLNSLVELARPILSLMKDMDSFLQTQGLIVPALGIPPADDAAITDERMRRVRSMLFMSLDKIHAQAQVLLQAAEGLNNNDEPKVTELVMRLHTIVGVLESD